jgi:hypothetical protein
MKTGDKVYYTAPAPKEANGIIFTVAEVKTIKCKSIPDYQRIIATSETGAISLIDAHIVHFQAVQS